MTVPLMVLAVPSAAIGLVGTPFANYFEEFVRPPGEADRGAGRKRGSHSIGTEFLVMGGSSVGIALLGITLASFMYMSKKIDAGAIAKAIRPLYLFSLNKWYLDDINDALFVRGSRRLARQDHGSGLSGRGRSRQPHRICHAFGRRRFEVF